MSYHKDQKTILPELLAPAGSLEHLKAAVHAGADAVYFGGTRFGARAYAQNFTKENVIEGLDYLHFHDRKAYMTVNTLVKERELEDLYEYLLPYYEAGLEGVIVQDMGAASFIRDAFPQMEVHGSTQMMITDVAGAMQAKKMGMTRVVPARELSREEVARIKQETGLEVEVFIHGALCYCYSGQCLFSSMYGGRSGNRGRCAQPCRLPYRMLDAKGKEFLAKEKYLLSPKDLFSLNTLPSMIETGVDSLKIEGRMKNVEYVAGVVSTYRNYLDRYEKGKKWSVDPADLHRLEELYSRSGFTDGYWDMHNGSQMMSIDTPRHLGRALGTVQSLQKNKAVLSLKEPVYAKDLLVIPGERQDEVVLTVPSSFDGILKQKKNSWELTVNVPKTRWLRPGMTVYRRYHEKMNTQITNEIIERKIKYPVSGKIVCTANQPMELTLVSRTDTITIKGACPSAAQNRPITQDDILRQMKKTGNVPFALEHMEILLDDGLFVQASQLKELRQRGYELLEQAHLKAFCRKEAEQPGGETAQEIIQKTVCTTEKVSVRPQLIAGVYDESSVSILVQIPRIDGILLSMEFFDADQLKRMQMVIHAAGKQAYLSLPKVYRQTTTRSMAAYLEEMKSNHEKWDGIYINNINEMHVAEEIWGEIPKIYGASFYQWNHGSQEEILKLVGSNFEESYWDLPYELSEKESMEVLEKMKPFSGECLVYGRFPVMLSAQCLKKTNKRCNHTEELLYLEDRNHRKLPVTTHCHPGWIDTEVYFQSGTPQACYNMIWSDRSRDLIGEDFTSLLSKLGRLRMDFFHAGPEEIRQAFARFERWESRKFQAGKEDKDSLEHWRLGIE